MPTRPDPLAAWRALAGEPGRVVLESLDAGPGTGRWTIVTARPQALVRWRGERAVLESRAGTRELAPDPFDALREAIDALGARPAESDAPFVAGAIGWLSYELGRRLEPRSFPGPRADVDPPLAFGLYGGAIVFDRETGETRIVATDTAFASAAETRATLVRGQTFHPAPPPAPASPPGTRGQTPRFVHAEAVERVRRYIEAGDVYQANLSVRFREETAAGVEELWPRLRSTSPEPFAACLELEHRVVLSASMERLLRVQGRDAETRPIKGTAPRTSDPAALLASEKDRAELLMIVDLHRNDLGKVCEAGTVAVPTLFGVRTFAHVHHLEATITGRLASGRDAFDALRAVFPAGSVTGAPKIRAMQILEELEPEPRGVYCGAIGWMDARGGADFSVAIRTAVLERGALRWSAGGGIVWDSDPEAEWREVLAKSAGFRKLL